MGPRGEHIIHSLSKSGSLLSEPLCSSPKYFLWCELYTCHTSLPCSFSLPPSLCFPTARIPSIGLHSRAPKGSLMQAAPESSSRKHLLESIHPRGKTKEPRSRVPGSRVNTRCWTLQAAPISIFFFSIDFFRLLLASASFSLGFLFNRLTHDRRWTSTC